MCECSSIRAEQLARIDEGLIYLKADSARRLADLEERDREIQDRITTVVAAQTVVNSAIHGRVSRVQYLTLGALGIGAALSTGVDWVKDLITNIGN